GLVVKHLARPVGEHQELLSWAAADEVDAVGAPRGAGHGDQVARHQNPPQEARAASTIPSTAAPTHTFTLKNARFTFSAHRGPSNSNPPAPTSPTPATQADPSQALAACSAPSAAASAMKAIAWSPAEIWSAARLPSHSTMDRTRCVRSND